MDLIWTLCGFNVDFMIVFKQNIDGFLGRTMGVRSRNMDPYFCFMPLLGGWEAKSTLNPH